MNIAVIPAGGQGRRMGNLSSSSPSKQFLLIGGVPLIVHTLRQFELCPDIDAILVALPREEIKNDTLPKLCKEYGLRKVLPAVEGASERQLSIFAALKSLAESDLHERIATIAIHDAVRPFVTPKIITATINAAKLYGAALCALPATDTIKEVSEGKVVRTLPRACIYQAQTPQTFSYRLILEAHKKAVAENFFATDDAMLIEWQGKEVFIIEGLPENIKVTKPSDLILAEFLLNQSQQS
ncbi:MAG: 2-C-methyl-D-erythritol 4-phosphate cytidylyltransferase [Acidobacteria bacterium]|nr:2-C-methyl-D-erythritol 4-phosphate cytidylyltransferase [Acidobacteriota bacterium]